jgi:NAD(P)-dependent dehydrogenase (short-subunit alcohol dehydrogenase family)
MTQKLLPQLRKAAVQDDPARLIFVGSGQGIRTSVMENYAYQSGKAGLHHLARLLAGRLAKNFINVNTIAPGIFPSRNTQSFTDDTVAAIVKGVPRGRYGNAHDAAGAVLYLASRAGAYVTGSIVSVDGGRTGIG